MCAFKCASRGNVGGGDGRVGVKSARGSKAVMFKGAGGLGAHGCAISAKPLTHKQPQVTGPLLRRHDGNFSCCLPRYYLQPRELPSWISASLFTTGMVLDRCERALAAASTLLRSVWRMMSHVILLTHYL